MGSSGQGTHLPETTHEEVQLGETPLPNCPALGLPRLTTGKGICVLPFVWREVPLALHRGLHLMAQQSLGLLSLMV